jgi:hypothetical protein
MLYCLLCSGIISKQTPRTVCKLRKNVRTWWTRAFSEKFANSSVRELFDTPLVKTIKTPYQRKKRIIVVVQARAQQSQLVTRGVSNSSQTKLFASFLEKARVCQVRTFFVSSQTVSGVCLPIIPLHNKQYNVYSKKNDFFFFDLVRFAHFSSNFANFFPNYSPGYSKIVWNMI